jgi:tetratricopeptide (TPR) repeat protein
MFLVYQPLEYGDRIQSIMPPKKRNVALGILLGLPIVMVGLLFVLMPLLAQTQQQLPTRPAPPNAAVITPVAEGPGAREIGVRRKATSIPEGATLDSMEETVTKDPNNAAAQKTLGLIQFNAQSYSQAVTHLEQAMMKSPYDAESRLYLGYARLGVGNIKEGIGDIQPAIEQAEKPLSKTQRADGWLEIGNAAYKVLKDDALAAKAFRDCLTLDPKRSEAALALGTWYASVKKTPEAKKLFEQARDSAQDPKLKAQAEACLKRLLKI